MNQQSKIKILYIIPSLSSGGAERFILDLIYSLDKNIFEPSLLLFDKKGLFYDEAINKGIKIETLKKNFKLDLFNFYKIYKYIKKEKPAIVHTQLGGDIYGKLATKLIGGIKIVSTEQNVLQNDNIVNTFLKKITANFSDKIIAISSAVKDDIIARYKLPASKVELIPNGVNIEKFNKTEKDSSDNKKIFLGSIGRLVPQKNFSLLFQALSLVDNKNFECQIVGEGELKTKLEQEINLLGLSDKVKLLGSRNDINNFLVKLDFFVLPSKWEGLGVVLLEAGLAKLPVLASATGGITDIIKDDQTGKLFKNNDLASLVLGLNYFLDEKNKDSLNIFGRNLHIFVKENFSLEKVGFEYKNMYLKII
ncbi:MAG: glycosyltransferase [Patescibacteria group bacterium]|jgi:glycosyltransferase involved in cell wall biosynthesis